jgi:signal transduction histidine kinase
VIETPQLPVVFVAIGLGAGLAILATALVAQRAVDDLGRVLAVADDVAAGDLEARTGVDRPDEIGQLAAAVDSMVAALDAAARQRDADEAARRAFLVAVGHDLRTPLTAISAAAEALEDGLARDPAAYTRAIRTQVATMERLVADLTRLTALEAGDVRIEPVDLAELVDETLEVMGPLAAGAGASLSAQVDAGTWSLDPHAVGRLLRNLVENAIEHSPTDGEVRITVVAGERLRIDVSDDGPGFPTELGDTVFDRFVTGDPSRREEGFGLGLAIARSVVAAHGGSIAIGPGPGGRVDVELPAHPTPTPTS